MFNHLPSIGLLISSLCLFSACSNQIDVKIKTSLSNHYKEYASKNNKELKSIVIDSISYTLTDSTAYYNYQLSLLEKRSDYFSRMGKLRTNLAQSHLNSFLTMDESKKYSQEKHKIDLDKSLEALQKNEREWNVVNDSMDLLLSAVHTTDTSIKAFYKVSYILKATMGTENMLRNPASAILNYSDYKVVFVE